MIVMLPLYIWYMVYLYYCLIVKVHQSHADTPTHGTCMHAALCFFHGCTTATTTALFLLARAALFLLEGGHGAAPVGSPGAA